MAEALTCRVPVAGRRVAEKVVFAAAGGAGGAVAPLAPTARGCHAHLREGTNR